MTAPDKKTDRVQRAQQSLQQMLETIGPYLPKRVFGTEPEPSEWKLVEDRVWPSVASATSGKSST